MADNTQRTQTEPVQTTGNPLVPREALLEKVTELIKKGNYVALIGPRKIGKTTLLHQLAAKHKDENKALHLWFDLTSNDLGDKKDLYKWLYDRIKHLVGLGQEFQISEEHTQWNDQRSDKQNLTELLKYLEPQNPNIQRIVLQFDEVEGVPDLLDFFHFWNKIFNDVKEETRLKKFSVIIAGSFLSERLRTAPDSHFNIAKPVKIEDFSEQELQKYWELVKNTWGGPIEIPQTVQEEIHEFVGGHPQLLRETRDILYRIISPHDGTPTITSDNLTAAFNELLETSDLIGTLDQDVSNDLELETLILNILNDKEEEFLKYRRFSLTGAGAIIRKDNICAIRNKLYEKVLKKLFKNYFRPKPRFVNTLSFSTLFGIIFAVFNSLLGCIVAGLIALLTILAPLFPTNEKFRGAEVPEKEFSLSKIAWGGFVLLSILLIIFAYHGAKIFFNKNTDDKFLISYASFELDFPIPRVLHLSQNFPSYVVPEDGERIEITISNLSQQSLKEVKAKIRYPIDPPFTVTSGSKTSEITFGTIPTAVSKTVITEFKLNPAFLGKKINFRLDVMSDDIRFCGISRTYEISVLRIRNFKTYLKWIFSSILLLLIIIPFLSKHIDNLFSSLGMKGG